MFSMLRKPANMIIAVLLVAVLVLSVVLAVVGAQLANVSEIHRAIYNKSQKIQLAEKGDKVPLYNYAIGDIQIPAIEGVPVSTYKNENFVTEDNGFKYYYEDSELCSYVGVDVSAYNGDVDWNAVKNAGVDFVMLRIGGRGYGEAGTLFSDEYFEANFKGAKEAGLQVGVYFFSQARTPEEAEEEAKYTLSILRGRKLDYPIAFDWEIVESAESTRIDNVSPQTVTDCARAFCDKVKKSGYTPSIYTGTTMAYYKYDLAQLADIDIWYAYYNDTPDMYYNYMMWQYSCTGEVDGIEGDVDLNICFKNYK